MSMGILQARILEWSPCPPPGDLPNLGIEPESPALQADYLPPEPSGKPFSIVITYSKMKKPNIYRESKERKSKQQFHCFMVMDGIAFSVYLLKIQSIDWGTSVVTMNLGSSLPPSPRDPHQSSSPFETELTLLSGFPQTVVPPILSAKLFPKTFCL